MGLHIFLFSYIQIWSILIIASLEIIILVLPIGINLSDKQVG